MAQLPLIDLSIILVTFIFLIVSAVIMGRSQSSSSDYFLGNKNIPWWAICGSIVATETSTLTFIGVPIVSYFGNLTFIQVLFGYIIGRFLISLFFLPRYLNGEMATSYQYLETVYTPASRKVTSVLFLITRLLGDGVRLYATAIPLKFLTGWDIETTIIIIITVTIIFSFIGGIKTIIWTDFIQLIIYLIGGALVLYFLMNELGSFSQTLNALPAEKLKMFEIHFSFSENYTFIPALIGGILLTISSHGTDHLMVQRILVSKSLKEGQKALVGSGFIVFFQMILFLVIGLFLYAFYTKMNISIETLGRNEILPYYIVNHIPTGVIGLIIASIFAVAISTLSSSLNSMASSSMFDFKSKDQSLFQARIMTVIWGLALALVAIFTQFSEENVLILGLKIASILYGGILSVFIAARLGWKLSHAKFIRVLFSGIIVVTTIWLYEFTNAVTLVSWVFYIPIGLFVSSSVGYFLKDKTNEMAKETQSF